MKPQFILNPAKLYVSKEIIHYCTIKLSKIKHISNTLLLENHKIKVIF